MAGVGGALQFASAAVTVHLRTGQVAVVDGPFAETKELIAGFWIWKVASMEEAIEWAKRCPNPHEEDCHLEIRPVFELEDFGDVVTDECRQQEERIRNYIEA